MGEKRSAEPSFFSKVNPIQIDGASGRDGSICMEPEEQGGLALRA